MLINVPLIPEIIPMIVIMVSIGIGTSISSLMFNYAALLTKNQG
jgi:hypothetical protein